MDTNERKEGAVVHDLPDDLSLLIGKVITAYARLEQDVLYLIMIILQLHKPEGRLALRATRPAEGLEMAIDLLALKMVKPSVDTDTLRTILERAKKDRDAIGHGIWLVHPDTKELHLRLTRGHWDKGMSGGAKINRAIFPQAVPYGPKDCEAALANINDAISRVHEFGADIGRAIQAHPERFRTLPPLLNPQGLRAPKPAGQPQPPSPSQG